MNRLPFELLSLIVYFIEAESSLPTRRGALASLSRTNKTFHNIATSKLYLHVVLTSERRVAQWGRFYASRLNPWNLEDAKDDLRDLAVPTSITFMPSIADEVSSFFADQRVVSPRRRPSFNLLLAVSTPLTSFFFRNLTSFIVSPKFSLDENFVAYLFAPTRSLRVNLVHLELCGRSMEMAVEFIFGGFNECDYYLSRSRFDWETSESKGAEVAAYWERYCDPDQEAGVEPEHLWDDVSYEAEYSRLTSKAHIDFDRFSRLYSYAMGPRDPDFIQNHIPKLYPFSKLQSLTLSNPTGQHLDLLFTDPSYLPSLTCLVLTGQFPGEDLTGGDEIVPRIPEWPSAITRLDGRIILPTDQPSLSRFFDLHGQLQDTGPVSSDDWKPGKYVGPNLRIFDLSELRIV